MCGRFTLRTPAPVIAELFDLVEVPDLRPRYNIAPTQPVAAVRFDPHQAGRRADMLRWGLIPFWAKDPKIGYRTINARAETVAEKPAFRRAFRKRRCLVPADGFYEWQLLGQRKQPYFIHRTDDRPFGMAGLWERWEGGSETIESCTIIVTDANTKLMGIHDRMPVILPPEAYDRWLDPEMEDVDALKKLLRPCPDDELEFYPVSTLVNNPRNDRPELIEPLEPA